MSSIVVGGGISAMAAAAELAEAGPVTVVDRARRLGGRMAAVTLRQGPWAGHVVDIGAAYVTARTPEFTAVVDDWVNRGLLRPWTEQFVVASGDEFVGHTSGPMRLAARNGLRSLVEDLARRLPPNVSISTATNVERFHRGSAGFTVHAEIVDTAVSVRYSADALALCMPGPQAISLLGSDPGAAEGVLRSAMSQQYDPILSLIVQWPQRLWDPFAACFVNDNDVLTFLADDGDRRGDGAAVIVAHSSAAFAAPHLTHPQAAAAAMVAAVQRLLGTDAEPVQVTIRRWSLAKPVAPTIDARPPFAFENDLGLAGDAFDARPRVEAAWFSGNALGEHISTGMAASKPPTA